MTVENKIIDAKDLNIIDDLEDTKTKQEKMINIVGEKKRSYDIGLIGTGQAGSRLAQTFYELGYSALAFNTANQDLTGIKLPEANKLNFSGFLQGAAKELTLGHAAAEAHREKIFEMVSEKLADSQILLLATS